MPRSKELQKKLDNQWWYRLGQVLLWLIVLFTFVTGVSMHGSLIDGVSGAILNFLILIAFGKIIIYIVYGKPKKEIKSVSKSVTTNEKAGSDDELDELMRLLYIPIFLILAAFLLMWFLA